MPRNPCISIFPSLLFFFLIFEFDPSNSTDLNPDDIFNVDPLITKDERRILALTESGDISAVDVYDEYRGPYHLQFITLEPNSLFLPVLLHTDMVFYVHTGKGRLGWIDDDDTQEMDIERGDISRLRSGSVFYLQSHANPMRERLRIYAFFTSKINEHPEQMSIGAYSNISDLVLGFGKRVLQVAFKVSEEEMEGITKVKKPPSIVHMTTDRQKDSLDWRAGIIEALVGDGSSHSLNNGKNKIKTMNIFKKKPDFKNCNGWSLVVTSKDFHPLKGSDVGVFMVNLNKGSMMGPHWNPRATEIAVVLNGQGMIRLVCASNAPQCKNRRFRVKEGDVFSVARFHPMTQISFNNDSFVFMGFSTTSQNNHPQFLAGKRSVFQTIREDTLALSFNVSNSTIRSFKSGQSESVILECASCAEDEEKKMEKEIEKKKQEEKERERKEGEARKKQEEEATKRQEEEEARRREEEEAKKRQEEKEARKREEEAKKRQEEEEARKREEEAKKRQEEAARKREEEAQKRQEEEARGREKEEAWKKQQEEEARKKEEEYKLRQEEAAQREQEEARRQEELKRKEEERLRQEEAARREQEEARRQEEDWKARQKEKEARREEGEAARRREEKEWGEGEGGSGGGWKARTI